MGLFDNIFKSAFDKWIDNATDDELSNGYEERRQKWIEDGFGGDGEKTFEMKKIEEEIAKRIAIKWKVIRNETMIQITDGLTRTDGNDYVFSANMVM